MEAQKTVRLYYKSRSKASGIPFWQRIWDDSFATELMKRAKSADIRQAICFNVTKGYLAHEALRAAAEITPPDFPQCIELTDDEAKVASFLRDNGTLLSGIVILALDNVMAIANARI